MKLLITICLIFSVVNVFAQTDTTHQNHTDTLPKADIPETYFKFSTSYLSNAVYYGRGDSGNIMPYLTPSVGFYLKNGLSLKAEGSYLLNSAAYRWDVFSFGVGYEKNIADVWEISCSYNNFSYNNNSGNVQGDINHLFSANMGYDFNLIAAELGVDMAITSDNNQYFTYASINKEIEWGTKQQQWKLTPKVQTYFGTTGLLEQVTKRRIKLNKKNAVQGLRLETTVVSGSNQFNMMDLEFSCPLEYNTKQWGLTLTPTFSIPFNPNTTVIKRTYYKGQTAVTQPAPVVKTEVEYLQNYLYVELAFQWKLFVK